jgi:hypothetical protein
VLIGTLEGGLAISPVVTACARGERSWVIPRGILPGCRLLRFDERSTLVGIASGLLFSSLRP